MLPQWNLLERTLLEKAVVDHGFDITPVIEDDWLACRSSQLPERIWLKPNLKGGYALAVADRRILEELTVSLATLWFAPMSSPATSVARRSLAQRRYIFPFAATRLT